MLGIETKYELTDKERKFDKKFVTAIILFSIIGLAMVILPAYIKDIAWVGTAGFVVIGASLASNLLKGYFDWKRNKKRVAEKQAVAPVIQRKSSFKDFDPAVEGDKIEQVKIVEPKKNYTESLAAIPAESSADEQVAGISISVVTANQDAILDITPKDEPSVAAESEESKK